MWGPMMVDGKYVLDLSRKACRAAWDCALKRMGSDYINISILLGSGRDPNTPFEDTIRAMKVCTACPHTLLSSSEL